MCICTLPALRCRAASSVVLMPSWWGHGARACLLLVVYGADASASTTLSLHDPSPTTANLSRHGPPATALVASQLCQAGLPLRMESSSAHHAARTMPRARPTQLHNDFRSRPNTAPHRHLATTLGGDHRHDWVQPSKHGTAHRGQNTKTIGSPQRIPTSGHTLSHFLCT